MCKLFCDVTVSLALDILSFHKTYISGSPVRSITAGKVVALRSAFHWLKSVPPLQQDCLHPAVQIQNEFDVQIKWIFVVTMYCKR